jgi:hypothetical protein
LNIGTRPRARNKTVQVRSALGRDRERWPEYRSAALERPSFCPSPATVHNNTDANMRWRTHKDGAASGRLEEGAVPRGPSEASGVRVCLRLGRGWRQVRDLGQEGFTTAGGANKALWPPPLPSAPVPGGAPGHPPAVAIRAKIHPRRTSASERRLYLYHSLRTRL